MKLITRETPLGTLPPEDLIVSWKVAPDSGGYALAIGAEQEGVPHRVIHSGREIAKHESIGGKVGFAFSPDSKRLAYSAYRGGGWVVVVDGKETGPYDGVVTRSPVFSPDNRRVAWAAAKGETVVTVVDGVETGRYGGIGGGSVQFSPDSRRWACAASRGEKWLAVIDGKDGPEHDGVAAIQFSPDSMHVAYGAVNDNLRRMVVDGVEQAEYRDIGFNGACAFTADGRLVYAAAPLAGPMKIAPIGGSGAWHLVVDGKLQKTYADVAERFFALSPDGKRVAHDAMKDGRRHVVIDGRELGPYPEVAPAHALFSPDSSRFAFIAGCDGALFAVLDGTGGPVYQGIGSDTLRFSSDGKYTACVAERDGKDFILINDREQTERYDSFVGDALVFDGPARLHTLAKRGDQILRLDVEISEGLAWGGKKLGGA